MNEHSIQLGMLIVQFLGLLGLIWYACETMAMRKAARDQVESASKPCLTLRFKLRDPADALLQKGGAVGGTIVHADDGNFVVQNIGNGVALNVRYIFSPINQPEGRTTPKSKRYLQYVSPSQPVRTPDPVTVCRDEYEFHFWFQSIGGRQYKSTVTINNLVLTGFKLDHVAPGQ